MNKEDYSLPDPSPTNSTTTQQSGLSCPGKYLRLHPLEPGWYNETKKYGPNEIAVQHSSKRCLSAITQWMKCQPVNQRVAVQFPVRARAWFAIQVPSKGHARGKHTLMFVLLSFSLPTHSLKIKISF